MDVEQNGIFAEESFPRKDASEIVGLSAVVHARQQNVCGFRYLRPVDNVRSHILTFGKHTSSLCQSLRHKAVGKETGFG